MGIVRNRDELSLNRSDYNGLKYYYYIGVFFLYLLFFVLISLPDKSILRFLVALVILMIIPGLISYAGLFFLSYNVYSYLESNKSFDSKGKFLLKVLFFYLYLVVGGIIVFFSFYTRFYFLAPILFIFYFYFISINIKYLVPSYSRYLKR